MRVPLFDPLPAGDVRELTGEEAEEALWFWWGIGPAWADTLPADQELSSGEVPQPHEPRQQF